jgi:hypothetical protein
MFWSVFQRRKVMCHHCESHERGAARQRGQEERKKRQETRKGMSAPARIGHMQGVRWGEILPAPAPEEGPSICPHQRRRSECKNCGGRASARTSAEGEHARSAEGRASARRSECKECRGRISMEQVAGSSKPARTQCPALWHARRQALRFASPKVPAAVLPGG